MPGGKWCPQIPAMLVWRDFAAPPTGMESYSAPRESVLALRFSLTNNVATQTICAIWGWALSSRAVPLWLSWKPALRPRHREAGLASQREGVIWRRAKAPQGRASTDGQPSCCSSWTQPINEPRHSRQRRQLPHPQEREKPQRITALCC